MIFVLSFYVMGVGCFWLVRQGGYETETAWFFEIKRALYMLTIISRGDWLWFIQWCCRLSCWPTQSFAFAFLSTICYRINQWAFLLFSLFKMIGMLFNVWSVLRGHWLTALEKTCENIEQRNLSSLSLPYHLWIDEARQVRFAFVSLIYDTNRGAAGLAQSGVRFKGPEWR